MKIIRYDEDKRIKVLTERGIDLHVVAHIIHEIGVIDKFPNPTRKEQSIYVILYQGYYCAVPVVENEVEIFIKTAYLSRKLKNFYS